MENDSAIIDDVFEQEIGIDIYSSLKFLDREGILIDDMEKIANSVKNTMINEIEQRDIPYEYRFLLINTILCTMFKTTAAFHNEYMRSSEHTPEQMYKKKFDIRLVKGK